VSRAEAARLLGISRSTLSEHMRHLGIQSVPFILPRGGRHAYLRDEDLAALRAYQLQPRRPGRRAHPAE